MRAEIYTWSSCPFCRRAKAILDDKGVEYTEHVMDGKDKELRAIKEKYGHSTVPIVLVDGRFIGGCSDLEALAARGGLSN
jgi:glutaredoxin 3